MRALVPILVATACASGVFAEVVGPLGPCPNPPDLQASDCLGSAVAADAGQVLAAARGRDARGSRSGGLARWVRDGANWVFDRWIDSPRPAAGQEFGHALCLRNAMLAVGAPSDDLRAADAGAAWAFSASTATGWALRAELVPPTPEAGERFGTAVASNGQRVAVSAPFATVSGLQRAGRVLVFESSSSGFASPAVIMAPAAAADRNFGEALSCDGSWLIVGCPSDDLAARNAGAVFAYRRTPLGWILSQQIAPPSATADGRFGQSVCMEGTRLLIGEPRSAGRGCVHVFDATSGQFVRTASIASTEHGTLPDFGWCVVSSGQRMIAGAPHADQGGRAILVDLDSAPATVVARLFADPPDPVDLSGTSVAASGTVIAFGVPGRSSGGNFSCGAVLAADLQFDCDEDGLPDALALAGGAGDQDSNGVPDSCECVGDLDGNGLIDTADIALLLLDFGPVEGSLPTDLDQNGVVDNADLALVLLLFGPCG